MNIHETGEVRVHERLPEPGEAPAFEVDMPATPLFDELVEQSGVRPGELEVVAGLKADA